jgi:glycosyltransferase involved in cell wall biosynthesis
MIDDAMTAVVVPAFDEEAWIEQVLASLPSFVDLAIVVDDGSRDATAERAAAASCPATVEIIRQANRGVGAAIACGYRRAAERGAEVIAVMAGDGQMDPADLEAVVRPVVCGEADYVKGDRLRHHEVMKKMPWPRLFGTWALGKLTSAASGRSIHDSQCGYTAIAADALCALDLDTLWPGYGYPNDLIGQLALAGLRIAEVPVRPVYRGEASGLRARHVAVIGYLLARLARRRWIRERRC